MLKDYSSTTCIRYQIPWEGWKLTGLYDGFKVIGLHDRDYIHNDKNLVNPLFSGRRDLRIGKRWLISTISKWFITLVKWMITSLKLKI